MIELNKTATARRDLLMPTPKAVNSLYSNSMRMAEIFLLQVKKVQPELLTLYACLMVAVLVLREVPTEAPDLILRGKWNSWISGPQIPPFRHPPRRHNRLRD